MIFAIPTRVPTSALGQWDLTCSSDDDDTIAIPTVFLPADAGRLVVTITPRNELAFLSNWTQRGTQVVLPLDGSPGVMSLLFQKAPGPGTSDEGSVQVTVTAQVVP